MGVVQSGLLLKQMLHILTSTLKNTRIIFLWKQFKELIVMSLI